MNILLWILQGLLALHTVMGALWKFFNPAKQAVPSLEAIPHPVWLGISVIELALAAALVLPAFTKSAGLAAPIAALAIGVVMILYCAVHLATGHPFNGQIVYWGVVLLFCAFIAFGRLVLKPH